MIYDLDVKGMRKMIRKFSRTAYGRTVFTLAYAAFFFFLILTVYSYLECFLVAVWV